MPKAFPRFLQMYAIEGEVDSLWLPIFRPLQGRRKQKEKGPKLRAGFLL